MLFLTPINRNSVAYITQEIKFSSNLCPRAQGDGHFAMLGLCAVNFDEVVKLQSVLFQKTVVDLEVCVRTLKVKNRLLEENRLELDYLIEIHGAQAEHCKMTVTVRPGTQI